MSFFRVNSFLILFFFPLLYGCQLIRTKNVLSSDITERYSTSSPIYLSFYHTKNTPFHFVLSKETTKDFNNCFLRVRWSSSTYQQNSFSQASMLKFVIDNTEFIDLQPISTSKIVSYEIEPFSVEKELTYQISGSLIRKLAHAQKVEVNLIGKRKIVQGFFNKIHTFRAFQNFLKNSEQLELEE